MCAAKSVVQPCALCRTVAGGDVELLFALDMLLQQGLVFLLVGNDGGVRQFVFDRRQLVFDVELIRIA